MEVCSQTVETPSHYCPSCGSIIEIDSLLLLSDGPCPQCRRVLWFVRKPVDGVVILTFLPGLMSGSEGVVRVDEVLATVGGAARVVVNLSYLRLATSLFLSMLLAVRKRLSADQTPVVVCGLSPIVDGVFRVTHFDQLFEIFPDLQTALRLER
jgi:anti-sigma B factor antagonist